MSKNYFPVGN